MVRVYTGLFHDVLIIYNCQKSQEEGKKVGKGEPRGLRVIDRSGSMKIASQLF